jgi:hypothetical protein
MKRYRSHSFRVMPRCENAIAAFMGTVRALVCGQRRKDTLMISISRSVLLTAGLLAFPLVGAVAQQNDSAATGSAMKSAKSDTSGYTKPTITNPAGDSSMKGATVGDSSNRAAAGGSASDKVASGESTGPSGKQPR